MRILLFCVLFFLGSRESLSKDYLESNCDISERFTLSFDVVILKCAIKNKGVINFENRRNNICLVPEGIDARGAASWLFPAHSKEILYYNFHQSNGYWFIIIYNKNKDEIEIHPVKQSSLKWIIPEDVRLSEVVVCPMAILIDVKSAEIISIDR